FGRTADFLVFGHKQQRRAITEAVRLALGEGGDNGGTGEKGEKGEGESSRGEGCVGKQRREDRQVGRDRNGRAFGVAAGGGPAGAGGAGLWAEKENKENEEGKGGGKVGESVEERVGREVEELKRSRAAAAKWVKFVVRAKAAGQTAEDFEARGNHEAARVLQAYASVLQKCNAVDYHDFILLSTMLLTQHSDVLQECTSAWSHVLVDEFQDTSRIQFAFVKALCGTHGRITVVGDDDQSIFSFNGANAASFDMFRKHFPDHTEVRLCRNYRSTGTIVRASAAVISQNFPGRRAAKELCTDNGDGEKIRVWLCAVIISSLLFHMAGWWRCATKQFSVPWSPMPSCLSCTKCTTFAEFQGCAPYTPSSLPHGRVVEVRNEAAQCALVADAIMSFMHQMHRVQPHSTTAATTTSTSTATNTVATFSGSSSAAGGAAAGSVAAGDSAAGSIAAGTPLAWSDVAVLYRRQVTGRAFQAAMRERKIPFNVHGVAFYRKKVLSDVIGSVWQGHPSCSHEGCAFFPPCSIFPSLPLPQALRNVLALLRLSLPSLVDNTASLFPASLSTSPGPAQRARSAAPLPPCTSGQHCRPESLEAAVPSLFPASPFPGPAQRAGSAAPFPAIQCSPSLPIPLHPSPSLLKPPHPQALRNVLALLRLSLPALVDNTAARRVWKLLFSREKDEAKKAADHVEQRARDRGCSFLEAAETIFSGKNNAVRRKENEDSVMLTTMHQSKGLEWHTVFIVSANEGETPLQNRFEEGRGGSVERASAGRASGEGSEEEPLSLEEERRLFYVAMTRARHRLVIVTLRQTPEKQVLQPSRFIREIPSDLLLWQGHTPITANPSASTHGAALHTPSKANTCAPAHAVAFHTPSKAPAASPASAQPNAHAASLFDDGKEQCGTGVAPRNLDSSVPGVVCGVREGFTATLCLPAQPHLSAPPQPLNPPYLFPPSFPTEHRASIAAIFHSWARRPAFQQPSRLIAKVRAVVDSRQSSGAARSASGKEALRLLRPLLSSTQAASFAAHVIAWEQLPFEQRALHRVERQEMFQQQYSEEAMNKSAATPKQLTYLKQLGSRALPFVPPVHIGASLTTMAAVTSMSIATPAVGLSAQGAVSKKANQVSFLSGSSLVSSLESKPVVRVAQPAKTAVRASVAAAAPKKKEHRKNEEGVQVNLFKPKTPYIGRCLLNTKIVGDDAPGETWHMVFSTEGKIPYREGQSIGVVPPGLDKRGNPEKLRLYSIASSAPGDFGDYKTVSLCVKRLVYVNDKGETVKGVCSNFLCDLKPGDEVKITGPVGKEMLMPIDQNATIIMLGTGTGIAPFRSFLWRMFFEKHDDYKFTGLAWLFLGVPTSSSLLYREEFEKMKEKFPKNFRLDFAVSREQTNAKGEKMYIQTRMAEYANELWSLFKKDNTYTYMCGLKGMEKGIDEIMTSLAEKDGINWLEYKKQLKKNEQWNVETY
ncbi:unnamed protein product, partial [Closterium sp. Yama58-4]